MENRSRAPLTTKLPPPENFKINTPKCGTLSVVVDGHRSKGETVILTVHDVGTNTREMREFLTQPAMSAIAPRVVWVHVTIPGQEEGAAELVAPTDGPRAGRPAFPSLQEIAEELPVVLDELNVTSVVVLGDGAGANILLRFALAFRERVLGAVLLNCTASSAGFLESQREKAVGRKLSRANSVSHSSEGHLAYLHFGAKSGDTELFEKVWEDYCDYLRTNINARNLNYYITAFYERSNLLSQLGRIGCPMLLIAGARSEFAHTVHSLNASIQRAFKNEAEKRRQIEYLRVDGVVSPLHEKPEKLAECIQYFLQGLGILGSLSPVFLTTIPAATKPKHEKPEIVEFRSQLEKKGSISEADERERRTSDSAPAKRTVDDSAVQQPRPAPAARGRRMSMQEFDVPRGPDSFRAYGAQRIAGVRTPSISE